METLRRLGQVAIKLLICVDQLVHVVLTAPFYVVGVTDLPSPDETISSRVGRHALRGHRWALVAEYAINLLFFWQTDATGRRDHCRRCIEADEVIGRR